MDRIVLDAKRRTITGKKVRFLRRQGIIPVNVFGHNIPSLALEVEESALERALARAGTNALITLNVADTAEERPVLIRGYQRKPTTGKLLHVDFYQVSMTEKIRTEVPIVLVGSAPGVDKGGVLFKNLDTVEIECLPSNLVSAIEVDISSLTDLDQAIEVRDLKVGKDITILTEPETVVVKIMPPEREEVEEGAAAAAPAGEAGAESTETQKSA